MKELELIKDSRNKLVLYRLEHGIFDNKTSYNLHRKVAEISLIDSFEKLIALDNIKVALFPHQVGTAFTVANKLKLSALLADEVGLGKTIEPEIVQSCYNKCLEHLKHNIKPEIDKINNKLKSALDRGKEYYRKIL